MRIFKRYFAHGAQKRDATVIITVALVALVLVWGDDLGVKHVLEDLAFSPTLTQERLRQGWLTTLDDFRK